MATEIFPSSFRCDCGHESDFFEDTVEEMAMMSKRKRVHLGDGDGDGDGDRDEEDDEHTIVFYKGEAIEIICPKLGTCAITDSE